MQSQVNRCHCFNYNYTKISITDGKIKISEILYSFIKSTDGRYKFSKLFEKDYQLKKIFCKLKLLILFKFLTPFPTIIN